MVNVSANFHTLSIQDAPTTRVRIYFIGPTVDCTDYNDVTTNGTLLTWAAGDTNSNRRIGQDGIKFTEYYNPEYNVEIGRAVSSQIEMTLLNTDGGLNNFAYGRCKVFLEVLDAANSIWLSCPMGVYNIELPTKRKAQLIHAFGYDQMQLLDDICDSWWSGLNWSGGLTMLQIVQSMGAQLGFSISSTTATTIVNSGITYTAAPFDCVETTYREILELIAEATGTVARFDRNGALDLKRFREAQISGSTIQIDTDTVGNQCLAIDIAEYQVAAIDKLKVKIAEDDQGVVVGSGTNQYTILENLFLDGTVPQITTRATNIYNRLNSLGAYKPIQTSLIWDWSIEAGDIIEIVRDSTTYTVPIFQQTMTWRGGYVVSKVVNSGDAVRPVPAYNERSTYRMQSEMSAKVGDNEIISKINQSPESITIQANKVNLTGYVTFTNLSTPGQTVIDGGNITSNSISVSQFTSTAQGALAANATTKAQYYLSTSSSSATGGTWSDTVPTWASGKYVWTREATTVTLASGSTTTNYSTAVYDKNLTTALSTATSASSAASAAQTTANGANAGEHLVYISKPSGTATVSAPSAWVTDATGSQNTWTIKRPEYNSSYPVLFVATQRITVGGTVTCTTPLVDQTTTVIDGGHITTGTIDAGVVNVTNINASNITTGTMSANKISGGTLTLGGLNNTNGTLVIKDASNNTTGTIDNTGANIIGQLESNGTANNTPTTILVKDGIVTIKQNGSDVGSLGYHEYEAGSYDTFLKLIDSNGSETIIRPGNISASYQRASDIMRFMFGYSGLVVARSTGGFSEFILSADDSPLGVQCFKPLTVTKNLSVTKDVTVGGDLSVTGTLNSIGIEQFNITAGSSKTVTLANATAHYFVVAGSTSNHRTTIIAYATTAGAVSYTMTPSASSITVTTGTNSITIAASGYFVKVMHFTF